MVIMDYVAAERPRPDRSLKTLIALRGGETRLTSHHFALTGPKSPVIARDTKQK